MIILLVLGYVVVGAFELYLWSDRPWKKVLAYLCTLTIAVALTVIVVSSWQVPVPQPLRLLENWVKELWAGGGQ